MAFSHNVLFQGTTLQVVDITATADGDLNFSFAHGLGTTPLIVTIDSLGFNLTSSLTFSAYWSVVSFDGTNINLSKGGSAGTGDANPQVRVCVMRPHSVFQ